MYDELVKKLRHCGNAISCIHCPYWEGCGGTKEDLTQAADAIDALTAYVRQIEGLRKDGYYLQKTKMMTYGQATMTMPLPQPPKEG